MARFTGKNKHGIALLLSIFLITSAVVGGTLSYVIDKTPSIRNTFISDHTGILSITKEVEHPFGDNYVISEDLEFDFVVNLGANYADQTVEVQLGKDQVTEKQTDSNGCFNITLKPGQVIKVLDLGKGDVVAVAENSPGNGFTVEGENPKTLEIGADGDNTVKFVNSYDPEAAPLGNFTVGGEKKLSGRDWKSGDSFFFNPEYRQHGSDDWISLGNAGLTYTESEDIDGNITPSHTVSADGEVSLNMGHLLLLADGSNIFTEAGTYYFRALEQEGSIEGVLYDSTYKTFEVVVGDETMDGALEIQSINCGTGAEESRGKVTLSFENNYSGKAQDSAVINIVKEISSASNEEKSKEGYVFKLYDEDGTEVGEAVSDSSDTAQISVEFDENDGGTHIYTLVEEKGDEPGITYDDTEYLVVVVVEFDDNNDLVATMEAAIKKPTDENDGSDGNENDESDSSTDSVDNTQDNSSTSAQDEGMKWEESKPEEKKLPVVDEDWTGTHDPDNRSEAITLKFVNEYEVMPVGGEILGGTKILNGRTLAAEEFSFKLYAANDKNFEPIVVKNDAEGKFEIDVSEVKFDKAGTYEYYVAEKEGELGGIVYDDAEYKVTVVVTDDGEGSLKAVTAVT